MSSDAPRDMREAQVEVNRQALVAMGQRLTELEQQFISLEGEVEDLRFYSASSLETAKRLQGIVKRLADKHR